MMCCAPASESSPNRSTTWAGDSVVVEVDALEGRTLDLVGVTADLLAVLPQHLVLVVDRRRAAEHVRGIRVLGNEPERLSLAPTPDHDRRPWPRNRLRRIEQPRRPNVATLEGPFGSTLARPHRVGDLECLLEHLEPLAERRERKPERFGLLLVPRRPDPEPCPPARQDVEGRRGLDP